MPVAGQDDVQTHELPDAEHPDAGPFHRAECGPDVRLRLLAAQELGLRGLVVVSLQPDRAASGEVPAGAASVGLSKCRFTEYRADRPGQPQRQETVLDFLVSDVDAEYERIAARGVDWVMPPATQPWGSRSMIFRDPEGNLINVFSRSEEGPG
jgi:catechol 2,3-dioxygenase-like lactoylglutathione lyase family enzyme